MKKELFTKIHTTLEARISKCAFFLQNLETTDDLKQLTIAQAQQLQTFCRSEEALMTKIVQCDLYHIIGMGNLTAAQMMKFTSLIKEYLQYRSTIKALAMNLDKISQLPGIPVNAIYKAHGFPDLVLSNISQELEAVDYLPYAISGNLIQVMSNRLPEFITFWSEKAKVSFSENNFLQKLKAGSEYGGIRWTLDHAGNYVGVIKQDNVQQLFEGCAQKNN